MPASISIKQVPDELLIRLRELAKQHRRSLQGELLSILEEAVRPERLTISDLRARIAGMGLRTRDEATGMIRRERDAR